MNDREKKLLWLLGGAAFVIVNAYLYVTFISGGMQKMKSELAAAKQSYEKKRTELDGINERQDEMNWYDRHLPKDGWHSKVSERLAEHVEQSAKRYGVTLKTGPDQNPLNPDEPGVYQTAVVKALAEGRDAEIYRWLTDLQNAEKSRTITKLEIRPEKNKSNAEKVECKIEITQWFYPVVEGEEGNATAGP